MEKHEKVLVTKNSLTQKQVLQVVLNKEGSMYLFLVVGQLQLGKKISTNLLYRNCMGKPFQIRSSLNMDISQIGRPPYIEVGAKTLKSSSTFQLPTKIMFS